MRFWESSSPFEFLEAPAGWPCILPGLNPHASLKRQALPSWGYNLALREGRLSVGSSAIRGRPELLGAPLCTPEPGLRAWQRSTVSWFQEDFQSNPLFYWAAVPATNSRIQVLKTKDLLCFIFRTADFTKWVLTIQQCPFSAPCPQPIPGTRGLPSGKAVVRGKGIILWIIWGGGEEVEVSTMPPSPEVEAPL